MSSNLGRRDGSGPPARPTREPLPDQGSTMCGRRLAGRVGAILLAVTLIGACTASAASTPAPPATRSRPNPKCSKWYKRCSRIALG